MTSRRQRSEAEWQALYSELQALKRKLHSKSEALIIITEDLNSTRNERDQYKLMAEKLRVRCQSYKRQFSEFPMSRDQASLIQMLRDMKNQKMAHQRQSEIFQQKLNEALGDVKLLRERFARQRIGDAGVGPRHFPSHEREELVAELEDSKQQAEHFRREYNSICDEISELKIENKEFRSKSERLNSELNFMLNGDKKRIIDIDALCMENKYLQERVKQCQEEKNSLHLQINKLKAALNMRKATRTEIKPGRIPSSGLVISPKQIKEILFNGKNLPSSANTVADLQSIAAALLETINDKNLALHHLRNTNKILGNRVAELEKKIRTLEVAGLWSMTGPSPSSTTPKMQPEAEERVFKQKESSPGAKHQSSNNLSPLPDQSFEENFMSSLGSRLSKLTDVSSRMLTEYKLVSLTPESSASDDVISPAGNSDIIPDGVSGGDYDVTDDVIKPNIVMNGNSDIKLGEVPVEDHDVTDDVINGNGDSKVDEVSDGKHDAMDSNDVIGAGDVITFDQNDDAKVNGSKYLNDVIPNDIKTSVEDIIPRVEISVPSDVTDDVIGPDVSKVQSNRVVQATAYENSVLEDSE